MFGGVYAFASCIAQRIRQKQDGELDFGRQSTPCQAFTDHEINLFTNAHLHRNSPDLLACCAAYNGGIAGAATGLALGWSGKQARPDGHSDSSTMT